jgi:hypothetical protein
VLFNLWLDSSEIYFVFFSRTRWETVLPDFSWYNIPI